MAVRSEINFSDHLVALGGVCKAEGNSWTAPQLEFRQVSSGKKQSFIIPLGTTPKFQSVEYILNNGHRQEAMSTEVSSGKKQGELPKEPASVRVQGRLLSSARWQGPAWPVGGTDFNDKFIVIQG